MKKKILLLEDDITLNETIVDYLEESNYEVTTLYDGQDAYETIYEKNFDFSKKNYIHLEIDKLIPEKQNTNFFYSILKNKKFQISCSQQKLSNEFQISSKSDWERIYFNKIKSQRDIDIFDILELGDE